MILPTNIGLIHQIHLYFQNSLSSRRFQMSISWYLVYDVVLWDEFYARNCYIIILKGRMSQIPSELTIICLLLHCKQYYISVILCIICKHFKVSKSCFKISIVFNMICNGFLKRNLWYYHECVAKTFDILDWIWSL